MHAKLTNDLQEMFVEVATVIDVNNATTVTGWGISLVTAAVRRETRNHHSVGDKGPAQVIVTDADLQLVEETVGRDTDAHLVKAYHQSVAAEPQSGQDHQFKGANLLIEVDLQSAEAELQREVDPPINSKEVILLTVKRKVPKKLKNLRIKEMRTQSSLN